MSFSSKFGKGDVASKASGSQHATSTNVKTPGDKTKVRPSRPRRQSSSAEFMSYMQPIIVEPIMMEKHDSPSNRREEKPNLDNLIQTKLGTSPVTQSNNSCCCCCNMKSNDSNQIPEKRNNQKSNFATIVGKFCLRFSGAGLRRAYRLAILGLIFFSTISTPLLSMISYNLQLKTVNVTNLQYNTTVRFVNSNLVLSISKELPLNKGILYRTQIGSRGGGGGISSSRCSLQYESRSNPWSTKNKVPVFTNCLVSGIIPENFTVGTTIIEMHSTLSKPSSLTFLNDDDDDDDNDDDDEEEKVLRNALKNRCYLKLSHLIVESNYANINIRGIELQNEGTFKVHVSDGDISLVDVLLGDNANLDATSDSGNVLVLSRSPAKLQFAQQESQFCLSAPDLQITSQSCQNSTENISLVIPLNKSGATTSCSGTALMRLENASLQEWKIYSKLPTINASSVDGSLYVATLPPNKEVTFYSAKKATDDYSNTTKINVFRGSGLTSKTSKTAAKLNIQTQRYISDIGRRAKSDPSQIIFAVFDSGEMIGSSPHESERLVYTSRETFLGIEPWMLKMFSGTMLGPSVGYTPLRWNVPLPCPLSFHDEGSYNDNTPIISDKDTLRLMESLRVQIDSRVDRDIPGIMAIKKSPASLSSHAAGVRISRWGPINESTKIKSYNPAKDATSLKSFGLLTSTVHLILILMSLLVSSIAACTLSSVFRSLLSSNVRSYFEQLRRINFMLRLKTVVRSNPYKEPKYKEMYVKKLEQEAGKKATTKDGETNENNDDDDSDDDEMDVSVNDNDDNDAKVVSFPFAVPEIIYDARNRMKSNSLRLFLKASSRSIAGDRTNLKSLVPLRDFKESYHSYCFNQRLVPKTFQRGRLKELEKFGLTIKTLYDHRTDAFIRIRLCSPKEKRERQEINPFPRETSLSYFVRTRCIISPFDVDYCTFRDFSYRYEKFNNQNAKVKRCRPVPVTKREMLKLGVKSKRKQLKYIHAKPFESDLGLSQIQLTADSKAENTNENDDLNESIFEIMVFIWDFVLVLFHSLLIMLSTGPLIILPLVSEVLSYQSSSKAIPYQLNSIDIMSWDSTTYEKIINLRMSYTNLTIMGIGIFCFSVQSIELILQYSLQPFQLKWLTHKDVTISSLRAFLHKVVYFSFSLSLHVWFGYISLVLIWMILGAILDPYKYLPYAAAAGVLVSFASIKSNYSSKKFSRRLNLIKNATVKKFNESALKMLPLLNNGGSSGMKENEKNRIETRALELVESDSFLRKVLKRCKGVDLPTALGLASGSRSACLAASEALGMNFNILACITAAARLNHHEVLSAMNVLGAGSTFGKNVSSDLLTLVYRLAQRQNEESLRHAVKAILSCNVNLIKVSPHRLESIIAIGRGQINRIVDVVKEEASMPTNGGTTFGGETKPSTNTKKTRIQIVAAFLEIIRNDPSSFQELYFTSDWKELLGAVTELDTEVQDGIGYLRLGRVREPSAVKLLSDDHFSIFTSRGQPTDESNKSDSKTLSVDLASLLIGIARNNHDEVRLYGPGSETFSDTIMKASGIYIMPEQLQGLIAVARGCLIDVKALSNIVGLEVRAGITIAHLIAEPNGFGNPFSKWPKILGRLFQELPRTTKSRLLLIYA
jgi:hypothetical protein